MVKIKQSRLKNLVSLRQKAFYVLQSKGPKAFLQYSLKYLLHGREYFNKKRISVEDYHLWIKKNEVFDSKKIKKEIKAFKISPKISIITPVYNIEPKWLNKCIKSVKNQFYPNWELCLYDDGSTSKKTLKCLMEWKKEKDKRIKIMFGKTNLHISRASNQALRAATGKFVALLDNDDELSPNALFEFVKVLNENPSLDYVYSDEDKLDWIGRRINPFFKPDWSPDLLLSMHYTSHLAIFRKSILTSIKGFRQGLEGSQDYDLVLRFIEKTTPEKIFHIPKILYHWRQLSSSTSMGLSSKNYVVRSSLRALRDYVRRNNLQAQVLVGLSPGRFRIKRKIITNAKVSIIIPFRDQVNVLKKCIKSLLGKTQYPNYEIVLVNNQSKEQETLDYLKSLKNERRIKILSYDKPFNFAAINNFAAKKVDSKYILFLNNDTEAINKGWLTAMVEHIQREEVGAVGAKLIFPNDTIQHAGVVLGLGIAGHAFKYFPRLHEGYLSQLNVIKNYSAVTGACLLTKRKLFLGIKGFDEKNLKIAFNDVDYCLKVRQKGFLIVYTPYAEFYHYESLSRGNDEALRKSNPKEWKRVIAERKFMMDKWEKIIKNDPYYNPNLTKKREDFALAINEGEVRYV